jgi:hypothetical protein
MNGKLAGKTCVFNLYTIKNESSAGRGCAKRSPSIGGVWGGRYRISATVPFKNIDLPK